MRTAIPVVLILSLVTSAVPVAAQDRFVTAPGPIASSIATEAVRIAAAQTTPDADDHAWASVRTIERDTEVDVLDRAGKVTRGRLAEVNDVSLRLRSGVLSTWIARSDIAEITTPKGPESPAGAAGGVALGIFAALFIASAIGYSRCGGGCTGAAVVGLPVGLGIAGYHAVHRTQSRVLYRASQSSADVVP
jgi:hypothetical protein